MGVRVYNSRNFSRALRFIALQGIPFSLRATYGSAYMPFDPSQVYQPEADTCLLLEAALAEARPGDRILEIGTGSGLVAARLAEEGHPVIATDINPHAVRSAREQGVETLRADLLSGIRGQFDLILFNPPYLPTRPEERMDDWLEYALDGGPDGRAVIGRFAEGVGRILAPHGRILLLVSELTGIEETCGILSRQEFGCGEAARIVTEGELLVVLRCTRR